MKLTEGAEVTRQAIAKHLRVLESAGFVTSKRDGRENVYELAPRRLLEAQRWLDQISKQWDDTLERLRAFVEEAE